MSDGLDVSGGTTTVSTDDLERSIEQLARLSIELGGLVARVAAIDTPTGAGLNADQSRLDIDLARARLSAALDQVRGLHAVLAVAGRGYDLTERMVAEGARALGATSAELLGRLVPGIAITAGLATATLGGLWLGTMAGGGLGPTVGTLFPEKGVPRPNPAARDLDRLLLNPNTVSAARSGIQNLGSVLVGASGAPLGSSLLAGRAPYQNQASALVLLGRTVGLFDETPARLVSTSDWPTTSAPSSYLDRLERVPNFENGVGPQVAIERYSVHDGADRFIVYVGGTMDFNPEATDEPWDMTSNVMIAAGADSASVTSVKEAMAAAGVRADSPVQFTGYSQGGGVVAAVAASREYNVQGVLSFGGPTGQIAIPSDIPTVLVEHSDDLVPALGGEQDNSEAVLVRRDVFGGDDQPHDRFFQAHYLRYYLETARIMDDSDSGRVNDALGRLDDFTEGATLESSTAYRFEREEG